MNYPKVLSAKAIDDNTLLVEFDNRQKKKYDVSPLGSLDLMRVMPMAAL
jgi:hypothetical protein